MQLIYIILIAMRNIWLFKLSRFIDLGVWKKETTWIWTLNFVYWALFWDTLSFVSGCKGGLDYGCMNYEIISTLIFRPVLRFQCSPSMDLPNLILPQISNHCFPVTSLLSRLAYAHHTSSHLCSKPKKRSTTLTHTDMSNSKEVP